MNFWATLADQTSGIALGMLIGYAIGYFESDVHRKVQQIRKRGSRIHDDT